MKSPLQLKRCIFRDVRITAAREPKPRGTIQTNVNIGSNKTGERQWTIAVRVELVENEEAGGSYFGVVECVGMFVFDSESNEPEQEIERLVLINGTSMLYGAIRELVSSITARGPWPAICLVSQSFVQWADDALKTAKVAAAAK